MFRTKAEVNRHVIAKSAKLTDRERISRSYSFARLYYEVGDYETCRRYLTNYLSVTENNAAAHTLLGNALLKLGLKEKALEEYKTSYELDPTQRNLLITVCELLTDHEVVMEVNRAKYWYKLAESTNPHHPAVFQLKERVMSSSGADPESMERLLEVEIKMRPDDVILHARYLRQMLTANKAGEAFARSLQLELDRGEKFRNSFVWYETLLDVINHNKLQSTPNNWEHNLLRLIVLDKICTLSLSESTANTRKSMSECSTALHSLDQALFTARSIQGLPEMVKEFLIFFRAQLCFHAACYLLKKAKRELSIWRDAVKSAAPLLSVAFHARPPDEKPSWLSRAPDHVRSLLLRWNREASYRCSQAGHVLLGCVKENRRQLLIDQINQTCANSQWKHKIYEELFPNREEFAKVKTSYFIQVVENLEARLPRLPELNSYDDTAQLMYPDSLHHFVWLGLNKNLSDLHCNVFGGLQKSVQNVSNCSPETLSQIDVDAFLYCTIMTAQQKMSAHDLIDYKNNDKPSFLPADITELLCSVTQMKWWECAYRLNLDRYLQDVADSRSLLMRGIEVIRCIGDHGLPPSLLCILGSIFSDRANTKKNDKDSLEDRAALCYAAALPLLEEVKFRSSKSQYLHKKMFDYIIKDLSSHEIDGLLEEAKLFLGVRHMNDGEHEKAVALLSTVKSPYGSYHLFHIYKKLSDEQISINKENVTSEMRSKCITLLSKAKHAAYTTMDRIKSIANPPKKHPLYTDVYEQLQNIELKLCRIDADVSNIRNDCDGKYFSDDDSSKGSLSEHIGSIAMPHMNSSMYANASSTPKHRERNDQNSTAYRSIVESNYSSKKDYRLASDRLDAQIKQLQKKESVMLNFIDQTKEWLETNRDLAVEVREIKKTINDLKTINTNCELAVDLREMKKTINDLKAINLQDTVDQFKTLKISIDQIRDRMTEHRHESKTEVKELRKEINELKNGISNVKSGQSANNEHEDVYLIEDEYQSNDNTQQFTNPPPQVPFPQHQNILPGFSQRMGIPPVPLPPTTPYHPMYLQNPLFLYNQYSQLAQAGVHPIFDSSRPHVFPGTSNLFPPEQSIFPDISQLLGPANLPGPIISQGSHPSVPAPVSNIRPTPTPQPISQPKPVLIPETTKSLPLNVVITSSDPLPARVSAPQPTLSVTIPLEHIKGNTPHNYQIQMPVTVKSSISTPLSSVSTPKFGSNITSNTLFGTPKLSTPGGNNIFGTPTNLSGFFDTPRSKDLSNTSFNADKSRTLSEKSNASLEYDPCPNFKAIIALPDEVELTTGEENETVLFKARAQLFRFKDKQWKDRGIGDVKLLKNNKNNKVRVLMRREQVHKICANHIITADMELQPVKNEDKAYFWVANDYADEVLVFEKFTIRFKTSDIAKNFYDAFDKARKEATRDTGSNITTTVASNIIESDPLSLDKFKPKLGSWSCSSCYLNNDSASTVCEACETKKLVAAAPQTMIFSASNESKDKKILGGLTFSSTPTFKVASNVTTVEANQPEVPKVNPFAAFSFSRVSQSQQVLSVPQKPEEKITLNISSTSDQGDEFVPTAEFKPSVPLPSLVQLKTGEENEKVLFEHHAKLFRYDTTTKEWKERGLGIMKLLKNEETNKLRLLMRREQILKVCCNHFITSEMEFKAKGDNSLTWYAQDFAENEVTTEFFTIRFKNAGICKNFLNAIQTALVNTTKESKTKVKDKEVPLIESKGGFGDQFRPKPGSWNCSSCCLNNVSAATVCVACSTKRDIKKNPQNTAPIYEFKSSEGFGDKFKPKPGAWLCSTCYISNEVNAVVCVACRGANPRGGDVVESAAKEEEYWVCCCKTKNDNSRNTCIVCNAVKGSTLVAALPKFSFGIPSANVQSNQSPIFEVPIKKTEQSSTFSFGMQQTVIDNKSPDAQLKSSFSWKPEVKPADVETLFTYSKSAPANNPQAIQPWNVIQKISNAGFVTPTKKEDGSVSFAVNRTGKFEFHLKSKSPGKSPKSEKGEEDSDNEYAFEDEGDNIHFTPVVPLPDKVEIVTGEEDEDVLSCHRAKLYRFITDEFKERGIGDVKILKHKINKKLRVVMRREQVLKICLNHALTKDINYTWKDERSWLFSAPDFSEGQLVPQQFCLRFKTKEIAEDFRNAADKARGDATGTAAGDKDLQIITETKANTKDIEAARKLLLPDNFYMYKDKEKCNGCRGCDDNFIFPTVDMAELDRIHGAQTTSAQAESKDSKDITNTPFSTPCKSAILKASDVNSSNITSVKPLENELFSTPQGIFGSAPNQKPNMNIFAFKNAELQAAESQPVNQSPIFGINANLFSSKTTNATFENLGKNSTSVFGNNSLFFQNNDNKTSFGLPSSKLDGTAGSLSTETNKPVVSLFGQVKSDTKPTANIFEHLVSKESDKKPEDGKLFSQSTNESIFAKPLDSDKPAFAYSLGQPLEKADLISVFPLAKPIFGQTTNEKPKGSEPIKSIFGWPVAPKPNSDSIFGQPKLETITAPAMTAFGAPGSTLSPNVFGTKPNAQLSADSFKIAAPTAVVFGKNATINGNLFSQSQKTENFDTKFIKEPTANSQLGNDTKTLNSDKPIFNLDQKLTFTSLAAASNTTDFAKSADFTWEGAGQKLFTAAERAKADAKNRTPKNENTKKGSDDESGDEETKAEDEHGPHFDPIVPLPDKIVISTGEENEDVVFAERGKLYRYDGDTKQWKERGVGNVKLLHHTERKSYRLLLRREQVHKVVLNQLVTPDLELLPMVNSENAWTWAGRNHAESDIGDIEKLAVRFKLKDTAAIFKDKVDTAVQSLSSITTALESDPFSSSNVTIIAAQEVEGSPSSDIVKISEIENSGEDYYVVQDDDEQGHEEYDDYDNEDTDEGSIMCYMKCNVAYVGEDLSITDANIQVVYESDLFLGKILVTDNDGLIHSNMLILSECEIHMNGNVCEFQAMDSASPNGSAYPTESDRSRTLRVTFESEDDALNFHSNFQECVMSSHESHVTESDHQLDIGAEED